MLHDIILIRNGKIFPFLVTMLVSGADLIQPIIFKISILLIISDACLSSSTLGMMHLIRYSWYFNLKGPIISASGGCNLDVVFFGRNTNFMLDNLFSIDCWWLVALSRNYKTFRFSILQSSLFNTSDIIQLFIPAFLLEK